VIVLSKSKVYKGKRERGQKRTKHTQNWTEFLSHTVTKFREYFENEMTLEELDLFHSKDRESQDFDGLSLVKPCQIVVFDFVKPFPIAFLVAHNPKYADRSFYAYEQIKNPKEFEDEIIQQNPFWLENIRLWGFFKDVRGGGSWTSS